MDISVPLRYAPPGMDQFIIGWMQCIDSSEEIIKMSYGDKETVGVEVGEGDSSNGGSIAITDDWPPYNPGEIRPYEPNIFVQFLESSIGQTL